MTILYMLFALCSSALLVAIVVRRRTQSHIILPPGYAIIASDLGVDGRRLPGRMVLRDTELGLTAVPDLLLRCPGPVPSIVPVEVKPAWAGYKAGTCRPSHLLQLAAAFLACDADPRVGERPSEGWIIYVSDDGRPVPGGAVRVPNTPQMRSRVLDVLARMRGMLATEALDSPPRITKKCDHCRVRILCLDSANGADNAKEDGE